MTGESLRALALIFTIPLIMAGKYSEDNLLPILLNEEQESVTTAAPALSVEKSLSIIDSTSNAVNATLADGTIVGQVKRICMSNASNASDVTIASPSNADRKVADFNAVTDYLELIWNGTGWMVTANIGVALAAS